MQRRTLLSLVINALAILGLCAGASATDYVVSLRSSAGTYVCAEGGGGRELNANKWDVGSWESLTMTDINGGSLQSGDNIYLRTRDTNEYVSARWEYQGTPLYAFVPWHLAAETFRIVKVYGTGTIHSGDAIAIQAGNGNYVSSRFDWANNQLAASFPWVGSWETFRITVAPPGFKLIAWNSGVRCFKKDYSGGQPDYVTVVDLTRASIQSLTGSYLNGMAQHLPMRTYELNSATLAGPNRSAFAVINGTFFQRDFYPFLDGKKPFNPIPTTALTIGLKQGGRVVSYGTAVDDGCTAFCFGGNSANIRSNVYGAYVDPGTTDAVGTYSPSYRTKDNDYIGRTEVGVSDFDGDGTKETVLFFSSNFARKWDALQVLWDFGAWDVAQLDSGTSTFFTLGETRIIGTERWVPHAIAIYAGK